MQLLRRLLLGWNLPLCAKAATRARLCCDRCWMRQHTAAKTTVHNNSLANGSSYGWDAPPECLPPNGCRQHLQAGCAQPDDSLSPHRGTPETGRGADGCIIHFHDGARIRDVQHRLWAQRQALRASPQNESNAVSMVCLQAVQGT